MFFEKQLVKSEKTWYNNKVVKCDKVGVDDVEGPPVPMPNTEVKLDSAENTRMVTSREDRKMPTQIKLSNRAAFFIS